MASPPPASSTSSLAVAAAAPGSSSSASSSDLSFTSLGSPIAEQKLPLPIDSLPTTTTTTEVEGVDDTKSSKIAENSIATVASSSSSLSPPPPEPSSRTTRKRQPPSRYFAKEQEAATPLESRAATFSGAQHQQRNNNQRQYQTEGSGSSLSIHQQYPQNTSGIQGPSKMNTHNGGTSAVVHSSGGARNMQSTGYPTYHGLAPPLSIHDDEEGDDFFNSAGTTTTGANTAAYDPYSRGAAVGPHEIHAANMLRAAEHNSHFVQRDARQAAGYSQGDHSGSFASGGAAGALQMQNATSPITAYMDPYRRRSLETGQGMFAPDVWDVPSGAAMVTDPYNAHHSDMSSTNMAGTFQFGTNTVGSNVAPRGYSGGPQQGYAVGSSSAGYPIRMMGDQTLWELQHAAESGFFEGWMPPAPSSHAIGPSSALMQHRQQPSTVRASAMQKAQRKPAQRKATALAAAAQQQGAADEHNDAKGAKRAKLVSHSPIAGENRLKIAFISYGLPGEIPQHFGTKGYIIPDGIAGTHEVYHQRWKFEILHRRHQQESVVVTWNITNLASGSVISRTETPREARVRETSGHTICNQLLRTALKARAKELEQSIEEFKDNTTRVANTWSLIKVLQPKSCILGLLFFGLLHETVQEKMRVINPNLAPVVPSRPTGSRHSREEDDEES